LPGRGVASFPHTSGFIGFDMDGFILLLLRRIGCGAKGMGDRARSAAHRFIGDRCSLTLSAALPLPALTPLRAHLLPPARPLLCLSATALRFRSSPPLFFSPRSAHTFTSCCACTHMRAAVAFALCRSTQHLALSAAYLLSPRLRLSLLRASPYMFAFCHLACMLYGCLAAFCLPCRAATHALHFFTSFYLFLLPPLLPLRTCATLPARTPRTVLFRYRFDCCTGRTTTVSSVQALRTVILRRSSPHTHRLAATHTSRILVFLTVRFTVPRHATFTCRTHRHLLAGSLPGSTHLFALPAPPPPHLCHCGGWTGS